MTETEAEEVIQVFIVEDHELVRRTTARFIQKTAGLALCGEAGSAEAALAQIPNCQPQLILIDVSLPGMSGIDLIQILHEKYPAVWLLALSGHDESVYGVKAIRAGAHGYIMKDRASQLLEAIHQISNGRLYVSDTLQAILDNLE